MPASASEDLCPRCLLSAALGEDQTEPSPEMAASGPPFAPPIPSKIAAAFPALEIVELLGHGGMGAVYKARQPKLDRLVALKIIRPEAADDPTFAERFAREAKTLARLNHPNIVAIHDFGEVQLPVEGGTDIELFYFIMEFVDGVDLRRMMEDGGLRPDEALPIVPQLCDALQYAHEEGVVHRDIKPENILVDRRGRVRIADFGIAKLVVHEQHDLTLTATHQVMGTPRYMAPEQLEGSHDVDHRADIYSLGVVFYEMLTGDLPLGRFAPPSQKAAVDHRLDEVVMRSLEREPERRFQTASEIKNSIERISATPSSPVEPPQVRGPAKEELNAIEPGADVILEAARRRVAGPAVGLMVLGAIYCLTAPLIMLVLWFVPYNLVQLADPPPADVHQPAATADIHHDPVGETSGSIGEPEAAPPSDFGSESSIHRADVFRPNLWIRVFLLAPCLGIVFAVFQVIGAWQMKRLGSYGLAVIAALIGLFATPASIIGFPVAIWALAVLLNPAVREGFYINQTGHRSREPRQPRRQYNSDAPRGWAAHPLFFFVVANAWLLAAVVMFLGRKVARTQPTMYTFFDVGAWLYPATYNSLVGFCGAVAAACLLLSFIAWRVKE
jgi:serine/threonine protein kinase